MPINDDFKHQVKSANPLESVIGEYVTLKRSGRNYVCCCPFHSEKTPSFYINVEDGFYKCFGCGESGDVFSFIMKRENLDFIDALKFLAERAGIPMPKWDKSLKSEKNSQERNMILNINREARLYFYKNLLSSKIAIQHIKFKRNLSANTALRVYNMGFASEGYLTLVGYLRQLGFNDMDIAKSGLAHMNSSGVIYDFFRTRLMIPIIDIRGNVIAFGGRTLDNSTPKYLNSPDTPVFKKSEQLFSLNIAKKHTSQNRSIILAEGYMDVIALYEAGFKNAVASLGTSLTPEQVSIIKRYADEVIICYDNDSAGIKATDRAISLFLNSSADKELKVKVLQVKGAKDPDEYIRAFGKDKFQLLLDDSVDAIDFQLNQARTDLNLNTNSGKIEMLKRSANILAQIQNVSSREVYVSSVARECNIETNTFLETVDSVINKNNKVHAKRVYNNNRFFNTPIKNSTNNNGYINTFDTTSQAKIFNSEREIIAYISTFYDLIPYAMESLSVDNFKSDRHKYIFKAICDHAETLIDLNDKSIIHGDLNEDDFEYFLNLCENYKNIIVEYDMAQKGLQDCIKNLLDSSITFNNDSENKLLDLHKLKNKKLQEQKHKTLPR